MVNGLKKRLSKTEKYLDEHVYSNFSQLPDYVENPLVRYLPWVSVVLGLLCLLSAYDLWHTAHNVNALIGYTNNYGSLYGIPRIAVDHHMNLAFWLSMVALLFEAYLFFRAVPLINKRLKAGWDLIYYAFVLNVLFGIIMIFSYYGNFGTFLERLIFSAVCLYFLFEIRDSFSAPKATKKKSAKKKG